MFSIKSLCALGALSLLAVSSALATPVLCNPGNCAESPAINFQYGKRFSKSEATVYADARLPSLGAKGRYVVWATIAPENLVVVYSQRGWVPLDSCGVTVAEIESKCSHPEGALLNFLQGELTNKQMGIEHKVLVHYARTQDSAVSHTGYLFQCTDFAGLGFCLKL